MDDADHVMSMVVQTAPRGRLGPWHGGRGSEELVLESGNKWNIFAALSSHSMYTGVKMLLIIGKRAPIISTFRSARYSEKHVSPTIVFWPLLKILLLCM